MSKSVKLNLVIFICMSILITSLPFYNSAAEELVNEPNSIDQKLNGISEEEQKVLANLFKLTQDIEVAESEEKASLLEVKNIDSEIDILDKRIEDEENSYAKNQEGLKEVMRTYQRMGPGSYLEIIFDSDSLTTLIQRINILRDLSRNTEKLLDKLEKNKNTLVTEKQELKEKHVLAAEKENAAKKYLDKELQLKSELQVSLDSLRGEKSVYQEQLSSLQEMALELKKFLPGAAEAFSNIVDSGKLPISDLNISFSLNDINGSIGDKVLNEIMENEPDFPKIVFSFHPGKVEMSFPDKNLTVSGNFIVDNGERLKFIAEEGSFYGMPMEGDYIKELFSDNEMVLDFGSLLLGSDIKSIEAKEGYLEFTVS